MHFKWTKILNCPNIIRKLAIFIATRISDRLRKCLNSNTQKPRLANNNNNNRAPLNPSNYAQVRTKNVK